MVAGQQGHNLKVHIVHLDEHHQRLLGLFTELSEAMKSAMGYAVVEKVVVEMIRYAAYHFHAEEELMLKHNFPGYRHHKKEHEFFLIKANEFFRKVKKGEPIVARTHEFLRDWVLEHISGTDKAYSAFFLERGEK